MKAVENCLVHALVIVVARARNYLDYKGYGKGRKILPNVRELVQTAEGNLRRGEGIPNYKPYSAICQNIG